MTLLLLYYSLTFGLIQESHIGTEYILPYQVESYYSTFDVELQAFNNFLFLQTTLTTFMSRGDTIFFFPFQANYNINIGIRFYLFEIGYQHQCVHPVISDNPQVDPYGQKSMTNQFYITITNRRN